MSDYCLQCGRTRCRLNAQSLCWGCEQQDSTSFQREQDDLYNTTGPRLTRDERSERGEDS